MRIIHSDPYHEKCRANSKKYYNKDKKRIYYLIKKYKLTDVPEFDDNKLLIKYLEKVILQKKLEELNE